MCINFSHYAMYCLLLTLTWVAWAYVFLSVPADFNRTIHVCRVLVWCGEWLQTGNVHARCGPLWFGQPWYKSTDVGSLSQALIEVGMGNKFRKSQTTPLHTFNLSGETPLAEHAKFTNYSTWFIGNSLLSFSSICHIIEWSYEWNVEYCKYKKQLKKLQE